MKRSIGRIWGVMVAVAVILALAFGVQTVAAGSDSVSCNPYDGANLELYPDGPWCEDEPCNAWLPERTERHGRRVPRDRTGEPPEPLPLLLVAPCFGVWYRVDLPCQAPNAGLLRSTGHPHAGLG